MLGNSVGALITERIQLLDECLALDPLPCGDAASELPDSERRKDALGRAARCRDQQLRLVARALERVQSREPLGHYPECGRSAVVGQAVPAGERQHFDFGREQRDRLGERAHRRFVGGDHDRASAFAGSVRRTRQIGREPRQEARGHSGERQRLTGAEHTLERFGHLAIVT